MSSIRLRVCGNAVAAALAWIAVSTTSAAAVTLPGRDEIRADAFRVGDHYRAARPCSASSCTITNLWDDGVLMAGMTEHWRKFGAAAYRNYARNWANRKGWKLYSNTSGSQRDPNFHNRMMAGYAYIRLSQGGVSGASLADVRANLNAQLAMPLTPERVGLIDHVFPGKTVSSFSWKAVDAEFMALPVWTIMGRSDGRADWLDRGRALHDYQVDVMGLQDPATKLWFRDEAAKSLRSPNGQKVVWGRGTGWVAAALALALEELPTTRAEYANYRTRFVDLMDAARTRQRGDGFWNMNVEDPRHYPAPESSATALLTFAAAKGVRLGILDRATFEPMAAKAWRGLTRSAMRNDGYLGFVQGVGTQPVPPTDANFPREDQTAESNFGVGAFLLAAQAMHDIAPATGPRRVARYEAESLATTVSAGDKQADFSNAFADNGRANRARLNANGDFVQFRVKNVPKGDYTLRVRYRLAPDHGIWQLRTNGSNTGAAVDAYDAAAHWAEIDVANVSYGASGDRRYRFIVAGRNALSSGRHVSIDSISLYDLLSGNSLATLLLDGSPQAGRTGGGSATRGGATPAPAPVPLPASAALLLGGLGLLALARRRRARA